MNALNAWEAFDLHILARLARAPDWSQRFPRLKPRLDSLVAAGCIVRRPAHGAKVPLMVEITDTGRERLRELKLKARND